MTLSRMPGALLLAIFCALCLFGQPLTAQDDAKPEAEKPAAEEKEAAPPEHKPTTTVDPNIPVDQLRVLVKPLTKSELEVEATAWFDLLRHKARQIAAMQLGVKKTNAALSSDNEEDANAAIKAAESVEQKAKDAAAEAEKKITDGAKTELGLDESAEPTDDESTDNADDEPETDDGAPVSDDPTDKVAAKKDDLLTSVSELQDERTALADRLEVVLTSLEAKGGDVEEYRTYMHAVSGIDLDASDASATWAAITGWMYSKEGGQRWLWNIAIFLAILLLTWIIAEVVARVVNWLLERKLKLSQLAESLISRTIKNVILVVGFAIALTALEVDITPILAAIGAAGFIIGFALQGTLSNFASGLMILVNRPFDVGDVVTAGGITGTIKEMNLVSTTFRTFDNQTIHVPNNEIWGNVITNTTANNERRVDMVFGVGYDDDFEEAEQIIREVIGSSDLVLPEPEPVVAMNELGDSTVNIVCRPWVKTSDYFTAQSQITREVKRRFDKAGISIPYPQRDVHVYQHTAKESV